MLPKLSEALQPNLEKSDPETPPLASTGPSSIPTSTADSPSSATLAAAAPIEIPTTNQPNPSPILYSNPATGLNQTPAIIPPPAPPAAPSFTPSYRLFGAPSAPQYTAVPNPNIQPPGVSAPVLSVNPMIPGTMYTAPPGMPPYGSNGYMSAPVHAQHAFPPPDYVNRGNILSIGILCFDCQLIHAIANTHNYLFQCSEESMLKCKFLSDYMTDRCGYLQTIVVALDRKLRFTTRPLDQTARLLGPVDRYVLIYGKSSVEMCRDMSTQGICLSTHTLGLWCKIDTFPFQKSVISLMRLQTSCCGFTRPLRLINQGTTAGKLFVEMCRHKSTQGICLLTHTLGSQHPYVTTHTFWCLDTMPYIAQETSISWVVVQN
ncbi:hypothetical protein KSP40_PGU002576 [Platanthera guangdongensis]|uniref:Uncharacterized protein n=1 Tax=Platanthera guangdongensis TaxID=2320717 RepID=A0ABR2M6E8_9ASPA